MINGYYIVFEGIDGSGKTEHANKLFSCLHKKGIPSKLIKEPSDSYIGETNRIALNSKNDFTYDKEYVLLKIIKLLATCDRLLNFHWRQGWIADKKQGINLIAVRSFLSSLAYNSNDYTEYEEIKKLNYLIPNPDIVFYLDISVNKALERINNRNQEIEIFETKSHLSKVKDRYEAIWNDKNYDFPVVYIDTENHSFEDNHEKIVKYVLDLVKNPTL